MQECVTSATQSDTTVICEYPVCLENTPSLIYGSKVEHFPYFNISSPKCVKIRNEYVVHCTQVLMKTVRSLYLSVPACLSLSLSVSLSLSLTCFNIGEGEGCLGELLSFT